MSLVPASSSGAASSGVTLLGPYAITYQTPGVTDPADNGALVGPSLVVGSVIVGAFFAVTTAWTVATGAVDGLLVQLDPSQGIVANITSVTAVPVAPNWTGTGDNPLQFFVRSVAQRLAVAVYSDDGARVFTGGAADIYATAYIPA